MVPQASSSLLVLLLIPRVLTLRETGSDLMNVLGSSAVIRCSCDWRWFDAVREFVEEPKRGKTRNSKGFSVGRLDVMIARFASRELQVTGWTFMSVKSVLCCAS